MFKRMVLKSVLVEMVRLENATKKRSKWSYCGISDVVLNWINDKATCRFGVGGGFGTG